MTATANRTPDAFAEAFVRRHGEDCADRLVPILERIGLRVVEVQGVTFDGALVRVAGHNRGRVALRSDIREPSRKLFTLGHEVGHYVLPGHGQEVRCAGSEIENWAESTQRAEVEANRFAAGILMPGSRVKGAIATTPSMDSIRTIAETCATSLTASAIRLAELTTHRVAVVLSSSPRKRWHRQSSDFNRGVRGGALSPATVAEQYFRGEDLPDEFVEVPADAWLFEDNLRAGATVLEWSVGLPFYGAVLSLLYIPSYVEQCHDYQDPDDEEMEPEDFSLRRKHWPR